MEGRRKEEEKGAAVTDVILVEPQISGSTWLAST
jgi:hypothetical protein